MTERVRSDEVSRLSCRFNQRQVFTEDWEMQGSADGGTAQMETTASGTPRSPAITVRVRLRMVRTFMRPAGRSPFVGVHLQ
jgi:hypothetical protein